VKKKTKINETEKKKGNNAVNEFIVNALKGVSIGVANVIPGVSGGTLAVIVGVFERLINAIKSFDIKAVKLLLKGDFKGFAARVDFMFLAAMGTGMAVAIISVAKLFKYLFANYPVYIWAFFFGLILASIYYVGKTVSKWKATIWIMFVVGAAVAVVISLISPGSENANFLYVFLCGVVAICSMVLPGISGSFVLILMGNYELVVIKGISEMNLAVLIPFALGCVVGIIAFAHIISWIMKKFKDGTIATLTGFIAGSLLLIWPWKTAIPKLDSLGQVIMRKGKEVVAGYQWNMPELSAETAIAFLIMAAGAVIIIVIEKIAVEK
jgi:putative membrane protein